MFWKIFKHDFIKIYKSMGIFYALALIFAILAKIFLDQTNPAPIFLILGNICAGGMWGLAISGLINGVLKALNNLNDNLYGNGALFTRCLPVTIHTIFLEKLLMGALLSLTSIIVATTSAFIVYAPYDQISAILDLISSTTGANGAAALIFLFAIFYVEILLVFSSGTTGLVLGHKHLKNKNLWSVIYGFFVYLLSQAFIVGSIALAGFFEPDIFSIFDPSNGVISPNVIKIATITSTASYLFCAVALSFFSDHLISKGVDIS